MKKTNHQRSFISDSKQSNANKKNERCIKISSENSEMTFDNLRSHVILIVVNFSLFIVALINQLYTAAFIMLAVAIVLSVAFYFFYIGYNQASVKSSSNRINCV